MKASTLVFIRIILYSIWALSSAWTTAMADVLWNSMGWEARSCLMVGIVLSWTGMMMAFFDKSVWKLDEERKTNGTAAPVAADPPKP